MEMTYAHYRALDIPLEEPLESRTSDLIAWATERFSPLSIKSSPMLRLNSIPVIRYPYFLLRRDRTNHDHTTQHPPLRQHRPPAQPVPSLIYSLFAIHQQFHHARNQLSTIATVVRRFFPGRSETSGRRSYQRDQIRKSTCMCLMLRSYTL
jgi:hypothetical protein